MTWSESIGQIHEDAKYLSITPSIKALPMEKVKSYMPEEEDSYHYRDDDLDNILLDEVIIELD